MCFNLLFFIYLLVAFVFIHHNSLLCICVSIYTSTVYTLHIYILYICINCMCDCGLWVCLNVMLFCCRTNAWVSLIFCVFRSSHLFFASSLSAHKNQPIAAIQAHQALLDRIRKTNENKRRNTKQKTNTHTYEYMKLYKRNNWIMEKSAKRSIRRDYHCIHNEI